MAERTSSGVNAIASAEASSARSRKPQVTPTTSPAFIFLPVSTSTEVSPIKAHSSGVKPSSASTARGTSGAGFRATPALPPAAISKASPKKCETAAFAI